MLAAASPDGPLARFAIGGTIVVFDAQRQTLRIVALARVGEGIDLRDAFERAVALLDRAETAVATLGYDSDQRDHAVPCVDEALGLEAPSGPRVAQHRDQPLHA